MASGEFDFIRKIKACQPILPAGAEGIGDDAAVIPMSDNLCMVVTSDALLENVHFRRSWASAYSIGRKAAAVNLSDIAAMGAEPYAMFLSVSFPHDLPDGWADDFISGVNSWNIPLLGGDTTSSESGIYICITAIGKAGKMNIKRRSTARPGNDVYVTGNLGDSAAGLYVLEHGISGYTSLVEAHLNPHPMVSEGLRLGAMPEITAMMDISDGLAGDLLHITDQSNLSAVIDCQSIPMSEQLLSLCSAYSLDPLDFALSGGEDYQLLFATDKKIYLPLQTTKVGKLCAGHDGILFQGAPEGKSYQGFTHF